MVSKIPLTMSSRSLLASPLMPRRTVANTGLAAAVQRLASSIVISDVDIQPLAADLFRVRIPTAMAHSLNCYLWLGPDGVTVVDTGWADSAPVIARALELVGRRTSDVERIVLSHFHDDHVGSAATVAQWSPSTVVAGRADTPFIRGVEPGPWPTLTAAEQALNPPMPGTVAPPPPCRVDHEAADGDAPTSPPAPWCCTSGATLRAASRCTCPAWASCSPVISSLSPAATSSSGRSIPTAISRGGLSAASPAPMPTSPDLATAKQ